MVIFQSIIVARSLQGVTYTIVRGGTMDTMDTRDLNHEKKKAAPRNLEEMSLEALGEYIAQLDVEIYRVRQVIAEKEIAQTEAKNFFRK